MKVNGCFKKDFNISAFKWLRKRTKCLCFYRLVSGTFPKIDYTNWRRVKLTLKFILLLFFSLTILAKQETRDMIGITFTSTLFSIFNSKNFCLFFRTCTSSKIFKKVNFCHDFGKKKKWYFHLEMFHFVNI